MLALELLIRGHLESHTFNQKSHLFKRAGRQGVPECCVHHTFSYVTNHKTVVCTALLRCERWCAQHFCVVAITNCWCAQHLPACSLEVASACTAFCASIKFAHVLKCWCAQHLPAWPLEVVSVCTAFCFNTKFAHVIKCWCAQLLLALWIALPQIVYTAPTSPKRANPSE